MFACIYGQVVPRNESEGDPAKALTVKGNSLVELAFTFSPLVEQTAVDTIVLDIEGQEILFGPSPDSKKAAPDDEKSGWTYRIASEIVRFAAGAGLEGRGAGVAPVRRDRGTMAPVRGSRLDGLRLQLRSTARGHARRRVAALSQPRQLADPALRIRMDRREVLFHGVSRWAGPLQSDPPGVVPRA